MIRRLFIAASLVAGCGQSAFDERERRAWSDSQGPPDGLDPGDYALAITTVDREQPGATIVVAGAGPSTLSTLSYDVGGELEQQGFEVAEDFAGAAVVAGALDPISGGNGLVAVSDGSGAIRLYDALTGDSGPAFRATVAPDACGGLDGLGGALVFALTDPGDDHEPDLVALAGSKLVVFHDLDLEVVESTPVCFHCSLPGTGSALAVGDFDGDGGEDLAVLRAEGDDPGEVLVFTGGQVSANDGAACGEPMLTLRPDDDDRFAAPIAVGDMDDNDDPEIAIGSPDRRVVHVLMNAAGPDPMPLAIPTPPDSAAFGSSLAFGDFAGEDGIEEIAVGDPAASPEGVSAAGQVTLYLYDGEELKTEATLYDSEPEEDQRFGRSLSVVEFMIGGSENLDLLSVGARGEVFTYFRVLRSSTDPRR